MPDQSGMAAPRRLHWSSLLASLRDSIRAMWGIAAGGAYLAVSGQSGWIVPVVGIAIGASVVGAVVRWLTFTYSLGGDEIRIDSGLLNRKHRSIPFDRVLDVDISQGPLARILGTARAKLETGGSAGSEDDGVLTAVLLEEAEDLRWAIRARRSSSDFSAAVPVDDEAATVPPVFAMDTKRLLLAGLFNFSLALFAGLIGASHTLGDAVGFDPFNRSFWSQLGDLFGPLSAFLVAHQIVSVIGGALLLGLVGSATGIVRTVLRDYGFRIDRSESGLRRRRGLITKSDVTLQARRVQAAVVGTGPVRDRFGWRALKLQSLAQDQGTRDDHVIAPFATDQEVDRLLDELRFGASTGVEGWTRVSRAYLLTFLVATSPLYLLAAAQMFVAPPLGAAVALAVAAAQLTRWLAWRRTAFVRDGDRLLVRTGWWQRRNRLLPIRTIQSIDLGESFISRRFGTATLTFGVAGGTGHIIPAIPRESARKLRLELLSSAA